MVGDYLPAGDSLNEEVGGQETFATSSDGRIEIFRRQPVEYNVQVGRRLTLSVFVG